MVAYDFNFCNPLNELNGPTQCSIACIDNQFEDRRDIYPDSVNLSDCHPFWAGQEVRINFVDYGTDHLTMLNFFAIAMGMGSQTITH